MCAICGVFIGFIIALVWWCGDGPGQRRSEQDTRGEVDAMGPGMNNGSAYKGGGEDNLSPEKMTELFMQWTEEEGIKFHDKEEVIRQCNAFMGGYKAAIYHSVITGTPLNTTPAPGRAAQNTRPRDEAG
jgi:hypothetical protein